MPRKAALNNGVGKYDGKQPRRGGQKKVREFDSGASASESGSSNVSPLVKPTLKRSLSVDKNDHPGEVSEDFGNEMANLLKGLSSDITKNLQSKRKRVQQYTEESIRTASKKVLEVSKAQSLQRHKMWEEFQNQLIHLISQDDVLEKMKESEDKVMKIAQQHQKQMTQMRAQKKQQVDSMTALIQTFFKALEELEVRHVNQYDEVHNDMRKEMANLQKKLLMDTHQQDMTNVRNQLKSLLG